MSLYIPQMGDTVGVTIPGLADNFNLLADSQIVEQGENENGEYWRWENGLQICVRRPVIFVESLVIGHNTVVWNFPAGFNTSAIVSALPDIGGGDPARYDKILVFRTSDQNTSVSVRVYFNEKPVNSLYVSLLAIGRWK